MKLKSEKGFIALMSAIVISILLLAITVSLGFSGYFTRFNILDSEDKERSVGLAEACGDTAILDLAQGTVPSTPSNITVNGSDHCTIIQDTSSLIQTQACINKSTTNLQITVDSNFTVTSWEELSNFSPSHPCT